MNARQRKLVFAKKGPQQVCVATIFVAHFSESNIFQASYSEIIIFSEGKPKFLSFGSFCPMHNGSFFIKWFILRAIFGSLKKFRKGSKKAKKGQKGPKRVKKDMKGLRIV